jgi:hypothetical protein
MSNPAGVAREKEVAVMRRTLLVLTVALVMAAMVAASALPVAAQGEGETGSQEEGIPCAFMEPGLPHLVTADRHAVITPSGNTKLTCHFEGPPIAQTTVGKGFLCSTPLGETRESHFVYTKSGNVNLTCHGGE